MCLWRTAWFSHLPQCHQHLPDGQNVHSIILPGRNKLFCLYRGDVIDLWIVEFTRVFSDAACVTIRVVSLRFGLWYSNQSPATWEKVGNFFSGRKTPFSTRSSTLRNSFLALGLVVFRGLLMQSIFQAFDDMSTRCSWHQDK